jgi:prolyl-tRNA editing enzyme YbaK/EbsC (Cys-tRNA(Pro) deacylase)
MTLDTDDAAREKAVRQVLDGLGAAYEIMPCDPALADTEAFCAHYGVPPEQSANTILVASRSEPRAYAACVLLATTRLDVNKAVRKKLGVRRVSFAGPEDTARLTGMLLGGVTPFGLPDDLPLWIDARVMEPEWVILGGGSRSAKVKAAPGILSRLPGAEVVEGLALPSVTPPG